MKICFDTDFLGGLELQQVFLLAFMNLSEKGFSDYIEINSEALMDNNLIDDYKRITPEGRNLLKEIVTGSTPEIDIDVLTEKLREIYPKGKKAGTEYHWRSNPNEVKNKLRRFFQLFPDAKITEEEIIVATEKYVRDMEYDQHMRLLKYFILKVDAEKDQNSDLYTYICGIREGDNSVVFDNNLI